MIKRPMLAVDAKDLTKIRYPILASPKLDGIRCTVREGAPVSRSFKPIRNAHVQEHFAVDTLFEGFDGELMLDDPAATFQEITSAIMSGDGPDNFIYHVFDDWSGGLDIPFERRYYDMQGRVGRLMKRGFKIKWVPHTRLNDHDALMSFHEEMTGHGFEGTMIRDPDGPYKQGRSTLREGFLLKVKTFFDAEGTITEVRERYTNANEQTRDAFGLAERSTAKDGLVPAGDLGALIVEFVNEHGDLVEFKIGTGFTAEDREDLWARRKSLTGQLVKFKFQELTDEGKPRFPVYLGLRHKEDLS